MFKKDITTHIKKDFLLSPEVSNTVLLILPYLRIRASLNGVIGTTLENIVKEIGYVPNNQKGRINETILKDLEWMLRNKYISINIPISEISAKKFFEITINNDNNIFDVKNDIGEYIPFVSLTADEYKKIIKGSGKAKQGRMLRTFLNIKKYINLAEGSDKICFPSLEVIKRDSLLSSNEVTSKLIRELEGVGVLYVDRNNYYKDNSGKVKNMNNVYALSLKDLKNSKSSIREYYKSSKKYLNIIEFLG